MTLDLFLFKRIDFDLSHFCSDICHLHPFPAGCQCRIQPGAWHCFGLAVLRIFLFVRGDEFNTFRQILDVFDGYIISGFYQCHILLHHPSKKNASGHVKDTDMIIVIPFPALVKNEQ